MSTTATIAITKENGGVDMIHVHWDGYLTWVGRLLVNCYTDRYSTETLINLGDLSTLGENLTDGDGKHPTVAYHRDHGEDLHITHYKNIPAYLNALKHDGEEFNYILGKNKIGKDQWYWVTDSDVKPLFYDENHTDIKRYFAINPKSVNIADLVKVENTFRLDKNIRSNSQKSIDITKEALVITFLKKLKMTNEDLFAPAPNNDIITSRCNNTITVLLQDFETHRKYGIKIYYTMIDLNQGTTRQVLGQLAGGLKTTLERSHALYSVDEIPTILKLSTIKKDINSIYHGKNKQGNIAFYYFLHLCHFYKDANSDREILEEVMPKLYKYVKVGVDKLYASLYEKYGITADDICKVLRTVDNGDPYQERTTPYEDYLYHLERGDNPKDPMLVGDPLEQSILYKTLKRMYQDEVAKDTEKILEEVKHF